MKFTGTKQMASSEVWGQWSSQWIQWPTHTPLINTRWQCFTRAETSTANSQVMPTPKIERSLWSNWIDYEAATPWWNSPIHCVCHTPKPLLFHMDLSLQWKQSTSAGQALQWRTVMLAPGRLRQGDTKFETPSWVETLFQKKNTRILKLFQVQLFRGGSVPGRQMPKSSALQELAQY